ncbi:MAG: hypothetical protein KatS3mg029_0699 [Saprospiraceae bacterium]|nr:MAG: hypothetical protein KatS3mg029_0699 [Saprospiraceae bacterium]
MVGKSLDSNRRRRPWLYLLVLGAPGRRNDAEEDQPLRTRVVQKLSGPCRHQYGVTRPHFESFTIDDQNPFA